MLNKIKIPELTGDATQDIAALWDFLYKNKERENGQLDANKIGCKKETVKFSRGKGRMICEGIIPPSAVSAVCSSKNKTFSVQSVYCEEAGTAIINLTESYSGIADISVFWSKEANGNV